MKKFYLLFAFAAMLFAGGCSDKNEESAPIDPGNLNDFRVNIQVSEITDDSCLITTTPSDNKQTYVVGVVRADFVIDNDFDGLIQEDIRYWKEKAAETGFGWLELLEPNLRLGESKRIYADLEPATQYYAWINAIDRDGTIASKVFKKSFTTTGFSSRFDVKSDCSDPYSADITVIPTNPDQPYYIFCMNKYDYLSGKYTDKKVLEKAIAELRASNLKSHKGEVKLKLEELVGGRILGGAEYYLWPFGVDDSYNIVTPFMKTVVVLPEVTVTDPCEFALEVTKSGTDDAILHVVPTNPETTYYIGVAPLRILTDDDPAWIAENFLSRQAELVDLNGDTANWQTNTWVNKGEKTVRLFEDLRWPIQYLSSYHVFVFGFDKLGHCTTKVNYVEFNMSSCVLFSILIEPTEILSRQITVKFTPGENELRPYYVGMITAEAYDKYSDWRKFVEEVIVPEMPFTNLSRGETTKAFACSPDVEYVVYAIGCTADDQIESDLHTERVHSLPLGEK